MVFLSYGDNLYGRFIPPDDYMANVDEGLLLPISAMIGQLSKLQPRTCVVELPSNTSLPLMARARRRGQDVNSDLS